MNNAIESSTQRIWEAHVLPSLKAAPGGLLADEIRYCPTRLLGAFALLMAGHGCCVNTSMMLGDREYAMSQLARAHTLHDAPLREVAARLFAYFHDECAPVPVGLRA